MGNTEELKEIAAQLRQPDGAKGIEMAEMMHATNIGMTLHAIERLSLSDNDHVLELGHGNGGHISQLLSDYPSVSYFGLELSALMHEEARRLNKKHLDAGRVSLSLYDGLELPFPDDYFDKIFTVNTIYFWNDPVRLLVELHRVLKQGGLLNITFAQRAFMEQLPFTQFNFELYDNDKIVELVSHSPFKLDSSESKREQVRSKAGDLVEREFTTVSLKKN